MTDEEIVKIIRENERMKVALLNIQIYCKNSVMGAWRQRIYGMAKIGYKENTGT